MHVCQEEKGRGTGSAVLLDHLIGERGGGVCQEEKGRGTGSAVLLDRLIGERGGGVNQESTEEEARGGNRARGLKSG
jgi:hypothetical protein